MSPPPSTIRMATVAALSCPVVSQSAAISFPVYMPWTRRVRLRRFEMMGSALPRPSWECMSHGRRHKYLEKARRPPLITSPGSSWFSSNVRPPSRPPIKKGKERKGKERKGRKLSSHSTAGVLIGDTVN